MAKRSDIEAGSAFIRLYTKDQITGPMAKVSRQLKSFGAAMAIVSGVVLAAASAIAAFGLAAVKHFADAGSAIYDMSKRTGLSAEAISELGHAVEQSGGSLEDLELAIRNIAKKGGTGDPALRLEQIADELAGIDDPGKKAARAMELMGKSATKLLPLMAEGAEGIRKARQRAVELGLSVGGAAAEAADALGDSMGDLTKAIKGVVFQIGAALAPALTKALNIISPMVGKLSRLVKAFSTVKGALKDFASLTNSFMNDVFSQLPTLAGYWMGRTVRVMLEAFNQINTAFLKMLAGGDMSGFLKNPFFTGAGAFAAGFKGTEAPGFKVSGGTTAKFRDLESRVIAAEKAGESKSRDSTKALLEMKRLAEEQNRILERLPEKLGELFPRFT